MHCAVDKIKELLRVIRIRELGLTCFYTGSVCV